MTKTNFICTPAYEAPACEMVVLGSEGVLCGSYFGETGEPGDDLHDGGIFDF